MGYELAKKYKVKKNGKPGLFITDKECKKGLQLCYGKNEDRNIWPGELSICSRHLYDLLECCRHDPEMLSASSYAIALRVVKASHLEYLLDHPTAIK